MLNTRVGRLLNPTPAPSWSYTFTPIVHSELYFECLEANGEDSTRARKLHNECPYVPPEPLPPKNKWELPKYRDWVPVTLEVTAKGKVRCHIKPGMADLYNSPCHHKPSIETRLKACRDFGYPTEVLLDVLKKHEKRIENKPAIDEFFLSVFGDEPLKKVAPPKKKTLQQIFKFRKMVYAKPDDDPEEEDARSDVDEPVEVDDV
jgi:hypothetical protein